MLSGYLYVDGESHYMRSRDCWRGMHTSELGQQRVPRVVPPSNRQVEAEETFTPATE